MERRYPCPICDADPAQREQLRDDRELCNGCNLVIRLDDRGELVEWWATQRRRAAGIVTRAAAAMATAVVMIVVMASTSCASARAHAGPGPGPVMPIQEVQRIVFSDVIPPEVLVCVPTRELSTNPFVCVPLGELRRQLRSRRFARADVSLGRP